MGEYDQMSAPVADRRPDRHPGSVEELREATDSLHYEIDMLSDQLQPIMRPGNEESKVPQLADAGNTEIELLVQRVRAAAGRISTLRARSAV
jgi:hypothetical protein